MSEGRENSREAGSRERQGREVQARARAWAPAGALPTPKEVDGWKYRWVRRSMLGQNDPTNMSKRIREGYETVRAEDHPDLKLFIDPSARSSGLVEVGGLVLCRTPVEFSQQRKAHYEGLAEQQMQAVDNQFMKNNDPRMPLFAERKSEVSFGKGQ